MSKLLKYEFLRKRMTYLIGLVALIVAEAIMFFNYFHLDIAIRPFKAVPYVIGLQVILAIAFFIAFLVSAVQALWKDLFHKEGYMIFMTPQNGHKIIGSKLITSIIEILFLMLVWAGLFKFNLGMTQANISDFFGFDFQSLNSVTLYEWIKVILDIVVGFIQLCLVIYFAMTLYKSFFMNVRFKGLLVTGMVFGLMVVIAYIENFVINTLGFDSMTTATQFSISSDYTLVSFGFNVLLTLCFYFANVYLIDKKINL